MKAKKQLLSLLLCGTMALSGLPMTAYAKNNIQPNADEEFSDSISNDLFISEAVGLDAPAGGVGESDTSVFSDSIMPAAYSARTDGGIGENTTQDGIKAVFGEDNITLNTNTITLIEDVVVDNTVIFQGGTWVLDLNGHNLNGADGTGNNGVCPIEVTGGKLTIQGSGSISGGAGSGTNDWRNGYSGGNGINITGGSVYCSGTVTINGGNGAAGIDVIDIDAEFKDGGAGGNGINITDGSVYCSGEVTINGGNGGDGGRGKDGENGGDIYGGNG